ncbi:hypothetical protein BTVI_69185 [Pitangus sulphuratus]|nr:hypothetical protein BTVI_69185 [Pitangus sulphuratus]
MAWYLQTADWEGYLVGDMLDQANLIAFYDGSTGWIDEGRAVDIVYMDFSMAFETVFHYVFTGKLKKYRLEEVD